MSLALMW